MSSSASRPKRLAGGGRSAQTLGVMGNRKRHVTERQMRAARSRPLCRTHLSSRDRSYPRIRAHHTNRPTHRQGQHGVGSASHAGANHNARDAEQVVEQYTSSRLRHGTQSELWACQFEPCMRSGSRGLVSVRPVRAIGLASCLLAPGAQAKLVRKTGRQSLVRAPK